MKHRKPVSQQQPALLPPAQPVQRRAGKKPLTARLAPPLAQPNTAAPVQAKAASSRTARGSSRAQEDMAFGAALGLNGLDGTPLWSQPASAPAEAAPAVQAKPAPAVQAKPAVQARDAELSAPADEEIASAETEPEKEEEERPGFFRRLGRGILRGLGKAASAAGSAVGSVLGLAQDAVHGVANLATRGAAAAGRGLENIGLEGVGQAIQNGAQGVRDFFGLDEDGTEFTGHVEIPEDKPDDPEQTQQYSELGLPITDDAWAMQNAIDGGALERTFDETLLGALQRGGILDRLVQSGAISPETIPASFHELDPEAFRTLMDAVKSQLGSGRAFLDRLEPEERESFQEEVIRRYMDLAKSDEDATFMLELMPTDTSNAMGAELGGAAADAAIKGQAPHTFRVGQTVGKIRQGAVNMADVMREQGSNVYALPVPYANVRSNIIARNGVPTDGADNMHMYMEALGADMNVVGTGYSQGGAALMDYIDRYGAEDDLDQAVALAPMGGADRKGADGVFTGERNGVETLTVMNAGDPAKEIHGDNLFELISPMLNFIAEPGKQRGDGDLHAGFLGDPNHPLPPGLDPQTAMAAGTLGYPSHLIRPMLEDLFSGGFAGTEYERRGDFSEDIRNAPEGFRPGDPLPNHFVAAIDPDLLVEILTRDRAGFEAIGFELEDDAARQAAATEIAAQLRSGVATATAERTGDKSFQVTISVRGTPVLTTWHIEETTAIPRLTDASPQR
ncbi:hypothetical protein [Haliangium sp.]|uniref:hypothetical protein n=1 Tax=Haliangium sp. TaxID=2663208 RepID=UPI003D143FB9